MSAECKVMSIEFNKFLPSISKLLLFWFLINVLSVVFAGLLLTPFHSYEKWIEHSLFLAQLLIGIGLFYFAAYEFGIFPRTLAQNIFWETQQDCLVIASKYFLRYLGLFILLLGMIVGTLTILDLFSNVPGGFSQTIDWSQRMIIRYNELLSSGPGGLIVFVLGTCILAPVIEELFYRRMLFVELRKYFGFWVSALFSSFIFAISHVYSNVAIICMIGIYLAYVYEKEKNLSVNIILHAMINLFSIILMALINSFPLK